MDSPPPVVEEETPKVPLSHDALPLLSASKAQAYAIPVSALQAILCSVAQQQEDLLRLSDHFKHELGAAQASVGSVQALLHEWEECPPVAAGAGPVGPGQVLQHPRKPEPPLPAAVAASSQCLAKQPSVAFEDAVPSAEPFPSQSSSAEFRPRQGPVCVRVRSAPDPRETGSDIFSNPGPGESATLSRVLTSTSDSHAAELRHHLQYMLADSTAMDKDSVSGAESVASSVAYVDDFEKNAVYRLHARLGLYNTRGLVTARTLSEAVSALGIDTYSVDDMESMLRFMRDRTADQPGDNISQATGGSTRSGRPKRAAIGRARTLGKLARMSTFTAEDDEPQSMRMQDFSYALLTVDAWCHGNGDLRNQVLVVKEVLFSGDANKLVAELTQVRVDELAAPLPRSDPLLFLEPAMGAVIFLNGVSIGLQADSTMLAGPHWFYVDLSFTLFFIFEMLLRIGTTGARKHFFGPEWGWNMFDAIIVLLSTLDSLMEAFISPSSQDWFGTSSFSLMRITRLTRLTRLFRIFRLKYMSELRLMVKGLLGGLKTLFWAIVLLFFTIYVIAVLLTMLYAANPLVPSIIKKDELFESVPRSMLTSFRCFLGDCTTSDGAPVVLQMSRAFGVSFVFGYFASMMFVVFGIFNLVIAVYIESTIDAAKRNKDLNKKHRLRESLRIAHVTKRLLKKFCTAHRNVGALMRSETGDDVGKLLRGSDIDDVDDMKMEVSRELFLNVIQDPQVQWLMDELEIPPDRADLFDILDSNGSGGLEVAELIQGLLRVRGDAKKSDVIASLLATRALQDSFKDFEATVLTQQDSILSRLGVASGKRRKSRPERGGVDVGLLMLAPAGKPRGERPRRPSR